ncbi:MAG: Hsp33 family molecular chaperone HslO [Clostridia bacterium]|nr:Hsp33 family molecular chaperone HslO [Clostridia bacterium]
MNDCILRALTGDGAVRAFSAVTTNMVEQARTTHFLSPTMTAALGRTLTACAMMGCMLKNDDESISIQIDGHGPGGRIITLSDSSANVKGYADNPACELPLKNGKLDVGGAVGKDGFLGIVRDYGMKECYTGKVELVSGEIGDDLAQYFAQSEQVPSVVALGVLVDTDCSVKAAGGLIVQVLPNATDEHITALENMIAQLPPITTIISGGGTAEDILARAFASFDSYTFETLETKYKCDCSRDRIKRAVASLGKKEITDIINTQGSAELTCHFCNTKYTLSKDELEELIG